MANDKKAPAAAPQASSWSKLQEQAKDRPDIFPRLEFGESKTDEVSVDVEFLDDEPRSITFKDRFNNNADTPGLALNVRVMDTGDFRSIVMRDDASHGLTAGIAKLAGRNGGHLKGVGARIETRNYTHKVYGKDTRGYNVVQVPVRATAGATAETPP